MNPEIQQKLLAIFSDPYQLISRLSINDKDGKRTTLRLWKEQREILTTLCQGKDTYILKGRQIGSSSVCISYLFWVWLTSSEPVNIIIMAHKLNAAKALFARFRQMYEHLPGSIKPALSVATKGSMTIAKTGATVSIQSTRQDGGARSFSATHLLISEFAFARDAEELKAQAIAALNNGQLIIESTAAYWGDPLYREIERLSSDTFPNEKFLFFPWFQHHSYRVQGFHDTETNANGLTPAQEEWKRRKMLELGEAKFNREYPDSVETAYRNIGNNFFTDLDTVTSHNFLLNNEKPKLGRKYAIGVDTSAGVGGDPHALVVVDAVTREPIWELVDNNIDLERLAEHVIASSRLFHNAEILVESNGYGNILIDLLKKRNARLWREKWTTTRDSKLELLDNIAHLLRQGAISELPVSYIKEMRSFIYTDKYPPRVECISDGKHHGDRVIAYGLALQILKGYNDPYLQKPTIPGALGPDSGKRKNIIGKKF